jgi:hypothetical protein
MEQIYRVVRREPGTPAVERVEPVRRLLSPAEREAARREREEKRERKRANTPKKPPQDPRGGVDYSA